MIPTKTDFIVLTARGTVDDLTSDLLALTGNQLRRIEQRFAKLLAQAGMEFSEPPLPYNLPITLSELGALTHLIFAVRDNVQHAIRDLERMHDARLDDPKDPDTEPGEPWNEDDGA
jgi:hypothetical protein